MQHKYKVIAAAITGNIVEYYDFGIYAVFAGIIGSLFFPTVDPTMELILAFSVFSVGFMMRPLGGMVFGYIGDRFGRKKALIVSMIGMSLSTLCIGLLPTYESIGIFAPIILIVVRMIQGLCIGGEGTGSAIFIIEHMEQSRISLMGSLIMTSNIIGTLFANLVAMLLNVTVGINDHTWRYCFLFGSVMGLFGLYFRIKNRETPAFEKLKASNHKPKKLPVTDIIQKKKYAVLSILAIAASATSITYLVRGYLNVFLSECMGYSTQVALEYTIFTLTCLTVLLPVFGILTDRFGTNAVLNFGAFCTFFGVLPAWYLVVYTDGLTQFIGLFCIAMMGSAMGAPAYPHAINSFPPEIRYSGIALGWNLGNAFFGGTTPVICTILFQNFGPLGAAFYLIFTSSIFIILRWSVSFYMKNLRKSKF
jgi:MHS family proline/betaine transporter-like MFS transporter